MRAQGPFMQDALVQQTVAGEAGRGWEAYRAAVRAGSTCGSNGKAAPTASVGTIEKAKDATRHR